MSEVTSWVPGLGHQLWWMGGFVLYKATSEDTSGAYALSWVTIMPNTASRPSLHTKEDQGIYVLDGDLTITAGNQTVKLGKGCFLNISIGTAWHYNNPTDRPVTVLFIHAPAGYDEFQFASGRQISDDSATLPLTVPADIAKMIELAPQYGVDLNPPEAEFQRAPTMRHTPAHQGQALSVVGDVYTYKVTGEDTHGSYALFDFRIPPGGGPPPHVHRREDEGFYVLEGALTFYVPDRRIIVPAGGFVNAPKNIPHRFANEGETPVRALCIAAPAGIENFFREVGTPLPDGSAPPVPPTAADIGKIIAAAPKYGIEILSKEDLPPPS